MDSFVPEPRDRLEAPICKAIESKDYKQALKLVEKRLAKSSDSYLQALKFFIQCSHPLLIERGRGLASFWDLSDTKGGHFMSDELDLYDEAINVAFPGNRGLESAAICKMRADAVKNNPRDEKLGLSCFRGCLARENLEYAQQVAISLEKNFPSNRSYQFYNITITYLYAKSPACPPQKAMIYARLAYSKIRSLAASNLKITEEETFSTRCLQGPQELLLFHRLLEEQNYDEEGIKLLRDDRLGPKSKVAKGLWIFRRKQLHLMERRKEWTDLFETCHKLLAMSRANNGFGTTSEISGADWDVWKGFLRSVLELKNNERSTHVKEASKELEAQLDRKSSLEKPYLRNAFLAMLEFDFTIAPFSLVTTKVVKFEGVADGVSHRLFSLCIYFYRYGHTSIAFGDIKIYVEKLSKKDQRIFMSIIHRFPEHGIKMSGMLEETAGWRDEFFLPKNTPDHSGWAKVVSGTTQKKVEYLLKSSIAETDRGDLLQKSENEGKLVKCRWCSDFCEKSCQSCLRKLCEESLHAYDSSIKDDVENVRDALKSTDIHPADDWAIIAAMCLIKLAGCAPGAPGASQDSFSNIDTQELLQACAILEFAYSHSKANPGTLLLLVRLYSLLGAGSLAVRAFNRLGAKQIQLETLSYVLLDRISSLHPHVAVDGSHTSFEKLDPTENLKKLQRLYKNAKRAIQTNVWKSFENQSYDSIFQFLEVSDTLSNSMILAMSVIELRKISRVAMDETMFDRTSHGYDMLASEPLRFKYSDNSDYATFPNYEQSQQAPFEMYTRFVPKLSQIRTEAFLLLEELWILLSNIYTIQAKRTAAFLRLINLNDAIGPIDSGSLVKNFTKPEAQLVGLGLILISMIRLACDAEKSRFETSPDTLEDWGYEACDHLSTIQKSVQSVFDLVDNDDEKWIPTFTSTLHPLYTAYEAAKITAAAADFLTQQKLQPFEGLVAKLGDMKRIAKGLREMLKRTAEAVKERLNDNPWLDFVLQEVQHDTPITDDDTMIRGENRTNSGSEPSVSYLGIGPSITQALGAEFLENWAGEVVESWRDSARGLACFK